MHPPTLPEQPPVGAGRVAGVGSPPIWLFAGSRWRGQGCQMGAELSSELPGFRGLVGCV